MIKRIPVHQGGASVSSFKVETFSANNPSSAKAFDFVGHGIVRVVAEAGDKVLDSDISPDSLWWEKTELFIRFGQFMLPEGGQHVLTLKIYQLNTSSPVFISSAYTYTQIVLISI